MTNPGKRSRQAGTGASWWVSKYRARAKAPIRTGANTWSWTGDRAVSWARAGTWAGAGEWAGAWAVAITRTGQGAVVVAVMELRAENRALAGAVLLIAVPGPGWRWGSLGVGRGKASWNALGGILFTAGRFFLQPFIQLPLGSRGVVSLLAVARRLRVGG